MHCTSHRAHRLLSQLDQLDCFTLILTKESRIKELSYSLESQVWTGVFLIQFSRCHICICLFGGSSTRHPVTPRTDMHDDLHRVHTILISLFEKEDMYVHNLFLTLMFSVIGELQWAGHTSLCALPIIWEVADQVQVGDRMMTLVAIVKFNPTNTSASNKYTNNDYWPLPPRVRIKTVGEFVESSLKLFTAHSRSLKEAVPLMFTHVILSALR